MNLIQPIQIVFHRFTSIFKDPFSQVIVLEKHIPEKIHFNKIFSKTGPVVIEFGVGKGRFIKQYAMKYPDKLFFGVEKVNKWVRHTARRIENSKLSNVKMVKSTAESILSKVQPGTVSEFYILFPDPWPKRRHNFRRVIQTDLIQKIHVALEEKGQLYIATDHFDYFQWMKKIIDPFLGKQFEPLENRKMEFISNYQVKYEKEGRSINTIHLRKISS